MSKLNILNGKHSVDNYPYGRLKTTKFFEIEFVKKKGYRFVGTTINPKNGRINKPKKSTYADYAFLFKEDNGHIHFNTFRLNGLDAVVKFIEFIKTYKDDLGEFTHDENVHLWTMIISCIKIGSHYTKCKEGFDIVKDYLPATKVSEMIKLYGDEASIKEIAEIEIDLENIRSMEDKFKF
jgi:hypothetical protein